MTDRRDGFGMTRLSGLIPRAGMLENTDRHLDLADSHVAFLGLLSLLGLLILFGLPSLLVFLARFRLGAVLRLRRFGGDGTLHHGTVLLDNHGDASHRTGASPYR